MIYYILSIIIGFTIGVLMYPLHLVSGSIFIFLAAALLLFLDGKFIEKENMRTVAYLIAVGCISISFGIVRTDFFVDRIPHDLSQFESKKVELMGTVATRPIGNGEIQTLVLNITAASTTKISGRIRVTANLFPVYHYGDVVSVYGEIKKPELISEDDGRIFDYPSYLLKDGITETMSRGSIQVISHAGGNSVIKFLYAIEDHFVASLQHILPEPEAGLLSGIVLGTQTVSQDISDMFRVAGLSHIVVLSGYNITVVAESIMYLALFMSTSYAFAISVISVLLFIIMSGAGASSVRAGIMAVVALIGKRFGKTYSAGRALVFACFIMVLWNPLTFLYDPSFHLSVLATIAIVYVSPLISRKLYFVSEKFGFREIIATTLAAQIFVLPYILYMSGTIQLLSLPANILIIPIMPVTMFIGFITGLLGLISKWFGLIFGIPAYIIARYTITVANVISHVPFAQISISHVSSFLIVFIYIILFYILYMKNRPTPRVVSSDGYLVIEGEST